MNVDVQIMPARVVRVGAEVLWPIHGERLLWSVFEATADGLCARSEQSKDILIIPRLDFPTPVVVRKTQHNPYANQAFHQTSNTSSTNSYGGNFGSAFGGFYQGPHNG